MWYVIQVMTGKEDDIAGKLKEQGIRALVPKENRLIRSGGSWSQREYILFAGYVFLNMNYNADNYYKVTIPLQAKQPRKQLVYQMLRVLCDRIGQN